MYSIIFLKFSMISRYISVSLTEYMHIALTQCVCQCFIDICLSFEEASGKQVDSKRKF